MWLAQVVLEQDGDASELRHQHPHAGHLERQGVTERHCHTEECHQSAQHHLRVTSYFLTYLLTFRLQGDLYCVGWGVKLYSHTHSIYLLARLLYPILTYLLTYFFVHTLFPKSIFTEMHAQGYLIPTCLLTFCLLVYF